MSRRPKLRRKPPRRPDSIRRRTNWFHSQPGGNLTWANATIRSLHGPISTAWTLDNNRFTLTAQLPPNTTATVTLPNDTTHDLSSGTHTLACDL